MGGWGFIFHGNARRLEVLVSGYRIKEKFCLCCNHTGYVFFNTVFKTCSELEIQGCL